MVRLGYELRPALYRPNSFNQDREQKIWRIDRLDPWKTKRETILLRSLNVKLAKSMAARKSVWLSWTSSSHLPL